MGYRFTGFFARAEASLIEHAKQQWPGCSGQVMTTPFAGICVETPDPERAETGEAGIGTRELGYAMEDELPSWSARHPGVRLVFVAADCAGGMCEYRGFVCQNGLVEATEPWQRRGAGALLRLMAHLGVSLGPDEYFAPFERGRVRRGGEGEP